MSLANYQFQVKDDFGALVAAATLKIGATTLTLNAPGSTLVSTSVPSSAGMILLGTAAAPTSSIPVYIVDLGLGIYEMLYDVLTYGEMEFPITASKTGSTITKGNANFPVLALAGGAYAALAATQSVTNGTALTSISTALAALDVPTATEIANTIMSLTDAIEPGEDFQQTLRLIRAVLLGESTENNGIWTVKRKDGTTTALTVDHDAVGSRTSITVGTV